MWYAATRHRQARTGDVADFMVTNLPFSYEDVREITNHFETRRGRVDYRKMITVARSGGCVGC